MNLLEAFKNPAARVPLPVTGEPAIVDLPDPEKVTIPLEYPQGLVFPPLVQVGETVARNQVIGRSEGGNCVHASIAGTVSEISRVWTSFGKQVPAVAIQRGDLPDLTPAESLKCSDLDLASATRNQLLRAGGVISPWTTPAMDQAETSAESEIHHLVILGHDQEPTQHVQELLLQEGAANLIKGLRLLRDVAPRAEIALTVPHHLVSWARNTFGDSLIIVGVAKEYRGRLERLLVAKLTGITVPALANYRSRGIAVMSVETALAAQDALEGHPLVRKTLTLSGRAIPRPLTIRAPLGMSVEAVLAACGFNLETAGRVLSGGPMAGVALFSGDTPLDKFQQGIHLLDADELPAEVNRICVNCGRCVRACPVNLQVHLIGRCVEFGQLNEAEAYHPEACLECGLCAFVCPAGRPLVQLVKMAKKESRRTA